MIYLVIVNVMKNKNSTMSITNHAAPIARNAGCAFAHGMSNSNVFTIPVPCDACSSWHQRPRATGPSCTQPAAPLTPRD